MKRTRTFLVSALVSAALLGAGATAANAEPPTVDTNTTGGGPVRSGECGSSSGSENQGGTAGTNTYICGGGLDYVGVGPQTGQIASVIGPTVSSPGSVGAVNTSAGNGVINQLP